MNYILILSNTNDIKNAEIIANTLVEEKLAACVNIIPKIKSIYSWENKIVKDEEYLMLIKTKQALFEQVKEKITLLHPYEVPEIISIVINNGNNNYLEWIINNTL